MEAVAQLRSFNESAGPGLSESLLVLLDQASRFFAMADLPRAEQLYRQILGSDPNQPDALQGLGMIASDLGHHSDAIELFRRAVQVEPNSASLHTNFALVLLSANRLNDAIAMAKQATLLAPDSEQCLFNLASIYERAKCWSDAEATYRYLLRRFSSNVEALVNLGSILFQQQSFHASLSLFEQAVCLQPHLPEANFHYGKALQSLGRFDEAIAVLRNTLQWRPHWELAQNQIGMVQFVQGDNLNAIRTFREVLAHSNRNQHAWYNLGIALRHNRMPSNAIAAFRSVLEIDPSHAESYYQLGSLLIERGECVEGIHAYRKALAIRPGFGLGDFVHQLQYLCQWENLSHLVDQVLDQVDSLDGNVDETRVSPFTLVALPIEASLGQLKKCAEHWSKRLSYASDQPPLFRVPRVKAHHRRLRIGYLSADFRIHAVAFHLPELFSAQDRSRFEVYGFSLSPPVDSDIRNRIIQAVDHFVDIHAFDHATAAQKIAQREIDVLVDLQGHTQFSRPEILAFRPAPIQVSYLGYPGTLGADFIDYIFADDYVIPKQDENYYSESIVYLPNCYQVNDRNFAIEDKAYSRAECGLPEDSFIFCAFSTSYKITASFFDVWMRLLGQVAGSVLWIAEENPLVIANLRREAEQRGIAGERIVVVAKVSLDQHVARHRLADLFLDTYPYNGHATTSIAIRAGVPVVTLSGRAFASRVAGSILKSMRLEDCIASSMAEYEEIALRLASDRHRLQNLRQRIALALPHAAVFDGQRFAVNAGKAFEAMFGRWADGLDPETIHVAED